MKKRLRKKKKIGEFSEWGVLVKSPLGVSNEKELDCFIDDFIQRVESLGCYCGGGISIDRGLDIVVELGKKSDFLSDRLQALEVWLKGDPRVLSLSLSQPFDLWYGDDMGDEGDKISKPKDSLAGNQMGL